MCFVARVTRTITMVSHVVADAFRLASTSLNGRFISPYQNRGVVWMLNAEIGRDSGPLGGFLCDEMGLGKTVQMTGTMLGNPVKRTLVIVPRSVVSQWVSELNKFAPQLSVQVWEGKDVPLTADVVVTTYGRVMNRKDFEKYTLLHKYSWDRVVLDEAHEIRNAKSKTHKSVCALKCKYRWILTGTPVFNNLRDFVSLCSFFGIEQRMVQAKYRSICDEHVLRRTKEDVSKFNSRLALPGCDIENVELEMYDEEEAVYSVAYEETRDMIMEIFRTSTNIAAHAMNILEGLLRVRQCMVHPQLYLDGVALKTDANVEFYEGKSKKFEYLLDGIKSHPTEKSLVFSQFRTEMDMIGKMLRDEGITCYRIDGSVPGHVRDKFVQDFKNFDGGCVFLIQIKAGGVGLNLQEATRVYITAPSWNPATELQAIGRSHRTGQTKQVFVKKLIYVGSNDIPSIEQSMLDLQFRKSGISAEVLGDETLKKQIPFTNMKNVSIRDIKKLFSAPPKKS